MSQIQVYKILKPNTIIGISKELKIRDLPFVRNGNEIEILEYVNSWDNIRVIVPAELMQNFTVKCVLN